MRLKSMLATALIGAVLAMMSAPPAFAQTTQEIKDRGSINIGMLVDFPPFGILDEHGKPDGYDAEVARKLADYLGVNLNIVPVTGPNRIPYLLSNQVDVLVASLGITPERAEQVDFSQPYAGIEIYVYGDRSLTVKDEADLSGLAIGVARGSTQDQSVTAIAPQDAVIQRFDDDSTAVQALLSGQIPLIGSSNTLSAQIEKVAPDRFDRKFDLRRQSQGIVTRLGQQDLMATINAFLDERKSSGDLNELHVKWVGSDLPDYVMKPAE